jgi:hypothetical protein
MDAELWPASIDTPGARKSKALEALENEATRQLLKAPCVVLTAPTETTCVQFAGDPTGCTLLIVLSLPAAAT